MGPEPGGYISEQIGERGGGRPKAKCIRRFKFDTQEIPLSSAEASKEEERKEEKNTEKTALACGDSSQRSPHAHHSLPQSSNIFIALQPPLKHPGNLCRGESKKSHISKLNIPPFKSLTLFTYPIPKSNTRQSYRYTRVQLSLPADVNSPLPWEAFGETRLPYREINSPQSSH